MKQILLSLVILLCLVDLVLGQGSDPGITANRVFGTVSEIDANVGRITVKTNAGALVFASGNADTIYERMPPGDTERSHAIKITLADIAVGDGIYVRGVVTADRRSLPAQQILVVSSSDIAKKQEHERIEWRERAITGVITLLNPQMKQITIATRSTETTKSVIVFPTDKMQIRRYSSDSVKFSDAKTSSFEELKVGDQLRAKGERRTDGSGFNAEVIVAGSFRTIGGSIAAINVATGEIVLTDIQTNHSITVVVHDSSLVKRLPADFMRSGSTVPSEGKGGLDLQRMIEGFPKATLAELKAGDKILASSIAGPDPARVTAFTIITGVEPIFMMLRATQAKQAGADNRPVNLGTINLGIVAP